MTKIKSGDKVKLHYSAKFEDGKLYQSTENRDPEQFDLGEGQVIEGIRKNLIGMEVGEKKTFTVKPDEAFGEHDENLIADVDRKQFPDDMTPFIGQQLRMEREGGVEVTVVVTGLTDDAVTIDANHPLAGKTLEFDVEIVEID